MAMSGNSPPTILITGTTDGLGRALAHRLAEDGARLLLHGRDGGRLADTAREIEDAGGNPPAGTYLADFSSLEEVRRLAGEVEASTERLDVLINNAGIGTSTGGVSNRQVSQDGYELRFAVNYLATFLLTQSLVPLLLRSAPARVVNVASLGQAPIDFDDVMLERGYSGGRAYSQSKLAQITYGFELAERLPRDKVTVNSLHPGTYMPTKIVLEARGQSVDTLEVGVASTERLAVSPELEGVTGRFFDRQREGQADGQAYDPAARRHLWDLSLRLTGAPDVPVQTDAP